MAAIHQLVAGYSHGDAISAEARLLRKIFRSWGFQSEIFSERRRILPELRREAHDISEIRAAAAADDVVLLHLSIGSAVNDLFAELPCRRALLYHNITPPEFLQGLQQQIAENLRRGRDQMRRLSASAEVVMADSDFNAAELRELGYRDPRVLPLVLELDRLNRKVDRNMARRMRDGLVNILFVGRCAPNKRIEDLLNAFYYYQRFHQPGSRLVHAGSFAGTEQYQALLLTRQRELKLRNVCMLGSIPQEQLNALYNTAHAFLCMSEHEGFCIPLLESMHQDVPVLAYAAAAVPETLNGAGILFRRKRFDIIAALIDRVVTDNNLREAILQGQRERIARYLSRDLASELRDHLAPLLP